MAWLVPDLFFGDVAETAAFDQPEQFFGEVGGVVSGALEGLAHEEHVCGVQGLSGIAVGYVASKQGAIKLVDFAVGAKDEACGIQVALGETLADTLQHLLEDIGHFKQRLRVCFGQAGG